MDVAVLWNSVNGVLQQQWKIRMQVEVLVFLNQMWLFGLNGVLQFLQMLYNTRFWLFWLVYKHYIMSIPKTSSHVFPANGTHFTFFGAFLHTVWTIISFLPNNGESMFYQHHKKCEFVSCWQLTNTTPITHWQPPHTQMFIGHSLWDLSNVRKTCIPSVISSLI